MEKVTYKVKSEKEAELLVHVAKALGLSGQNRYPGYAWIALGYSPLNSIGWNLKSCWARVVTLGEFIDTMTKMASNPLRELVLHPIKGTYTGATVNRKDNTVQVGCCVYPMSDIEAILQCLKSDK